MYSNKQLYGERQFLLSNSEWLDIKANSSNHYTILIDRKNSSYKKNLDAKYKNKLNINNAQLIIDVLPSISDIKYLDVINHIKSIRFNYCSLINTNYCHQSLPFHFLEDDSIVSFNDRDMARALYCLQEKNPQKFKNFKNIIFRMFPDFEEIAFNRTTVKADFTKKIVYTNELVSGEKEIIPPAVINDQIYQIFIKRNHLNQSLSLEQMSSGTKRIFWILLNTQLANNSGVQILGIDELETSIHPGLLKKLLEEIDIITDNTLLLISSHSANILQYLKPEQIYVGLPNDFGYAEFSRVKKSKFQKIKSIANNLGMSYGEYIFNYISQSNENMQSAIRNCFESE